jgi:two-component system response regulator AtoC
MDEVGEMKAALQAKLLHAVQDSEFTKLGSNRPITVDVRVVAATNRDLEAMLVRGEFREDLYYRLKVIEITVPPLRARRDEISHLSGFFMDRYSRRYNRPLHPLSGPIQQIFQDYDWPGNIRELENMIKRIVILQDEQLVIRELTRAPRRVPVGAAVANQPLREIAATSSEPEDVEAAADDKGVDVEEPLSSTAAGSRLADVAKAAASKAERAIIEETLLQVHWNRRRAAEQLGVSYKTLLNKIKECGIGRK